MGLSMSEPKVTVTVGGKNGSEFTYEVQEYGYSALFNPPKWVPKPPKKALTKRQKVVKWYKKTKRETLQAIWQPIHDKSTTYAYCNELEYHDCYE
jgi:hypothetical protein